MNSYSKHIIFVLGADFSGTTMLDLMLGENRNVTSLGEVASYVEPSHRRHEQLQCSCHSNCNRWPRSRFSDYKEFYKYLLIHYDGEVFVDSSKDLVWVKKCAKYLLEIGCKVSYILIWKDIIKYHNSYTQRRRGRNAVTKWFSYHNALRAIQGDIFVINIDELQQNDCKSVNQNLSQFLGFRILLNPHSWMDQGDHHIIFGSATARRALWRNAPGELQIEQKNVRKKYHSPKLLERVPYKIVILQLLLKNKTILYHSNIWNRSYLKIYFKRKLAVQLYRIIKR